MSLVTVWKSDADGKPTQVYDVPDDWVLPSPWEELND